MKSTTFDKFAGLCAILAGIVIFLYALAFIVIAPRAPELGGLLSALLLLLNGLLLTAPGSNIISIIIQPIIIPIL